MFLPLLVLAEPSQVFDKIAVTTPWRQTLLFSAAIFFVILWLNGCWSNIRDGLHWWPLLGPAIAAFLVVGLISLLSTTMLYALQRALVEQDDQRAPFRLLFSLNSHCVPILLLGEIVNFLLMRIESVQDLSLPFANRFPVGLDLLLLGAKEPNIYLAIVLHSTSVFFLWYFVVLARGITRLTGLSPGRSAAVAVAMWLACLVIILGIVFGAGGGTTIRLSM